MSKPLDFRILTPQQRDDTRDVYQLMSKFIEFENKANLHLFTYLFGHTHIHIYQMFITDSKCNILNWFNRLDVYNQGNVLANGHEEAKMLDVEIEEVKEF